MINRIFQLIKPGFISVKYVDEDLFDDKVVVKPIYVSLCHADQRYYLGKRDSKVLAKKLPMAPIHESCGEVVFDPTGNFKVGDKVVMIPNTPPCNADDEVYENYVKGVYFLSSGHDGFMREFVKISADRLVKFENIELQVASILEFVSVGFHALNRFEQNSLKNKNVITIFGNGSLGFVMANVLKYKFPKSKIVVVGRNLEKLKLFSFVDEVYSTDNIPDGFSTDHAFECAGGIGSEDAINSIIKYINPQGSVMLMGVSENKVSVNTRDILEKGLTFIGCSRSGREDFENAVNMLSNKKIQNRFKSIIFEDNVIRSIDDIHRFFKTDLNTPFKTVAKWEI
ncbi:MAG: alcohol dehydrogenase catalytic domain-containing protein [Parvimonas sp.]|uniref:alcohol dehydrogenase catalytic domain-containing protein n=1 Tax=Parvimonas sp. TaxID=1944660 RepID=UPI0025F50A1D|nr:alcohol dehydrogenase catalytic domain-containing protein [Parvimonas sp.]MCI5997238.1 alcohol dehydrogenase catalytic domain-containing protein [Parvimonas sp.]